MTLSIITINYNNLTGLRKTVASIVSQTWHDFEWIIIDGGSTDGSKEFIENTAEELASSDFNPITFWCSESDKGIYNAINKGISHCQGEYINCMNSGDEFYERDTLQKVFANSHVADIVYGDSFHYSIEKSFTAHFPYPINIFNFYHNNICHQAMFVKTELLKASGFDEKYRICADYAKWIEFTIKGCSFEYIPITICRFDMNGMSNTGDLIYRERSEIQQELIPQHTLMLIKEHSKYTSCGNRLLRAREILSRGGVMAETLAAIIKVLYCFHKRK